MAEFSTGGLRGAEAAGARFGSRPTEKATESGKFAGTVITVIGGGTSALGEQLKNAAMPTITQEELGHYNPAELADEMAAARGASGRIKGQDKAIGEGGVEEGKALEEEEEVEEGKAKEDLREKQGELVVSDVDNLSEQRKREYNAFEQAMKNLFLGKAKGEKVEQSLDTPADYLAVAKKFGFVDITETYAVLKKFGDKKLDDDEDFKVLDSIQRAQIKRSILFAKESIFKENESAIRAGWNLQGTHSQLELYRMAVQKETGLANRFKVIMNQDPAHPEKFEESVQLLISYISQDLTAASPTMDPKYLHSAHDEIRTAQLCGGLYSSVNTLKDYLVKAHGQN